jgi:hypothetical protein
MVGALLGMLLDPATFEPVFPLAGERPEDALQRMRPPLAILLDGTLEAARSDLFLTRAQRNRASLVLFTPPAGDGVAPFAPAAARARGLASFALPVDRAALTEILESALARAAGGGFIGVLAMLLGSVGLVRLFTGHA